MSSSGDPADVAILALIIFGVYFLPSLVAWKKRDFWSVVAINLFLG